MERTAHHGDELNWTDETSWKVDAALDKSLSTKVVVESDGWLATSTNAEVTTPTYRLYWQRWLMLALYSIIGLFNNMIWVSFAALTGPSAAFFGQDTSFYVNLLAGVFLVTAVLFILPGAWVCDRIGVRFVVIVSAIMDMIACWLRYGATYIGRSDVCDGSDSSCSGSDFTVGAGAFWLIFVGQLIASLAQPLILPAPPKIAAVWFGEEERTIATGIAALATVGGVAVGYGMAIGIVKSPDGHEIPEMLLIQAAMHTVMTIAAVVIYRERPPTPPTASAAVDSEKRISYKEILRVPSFITILCTVSPGYGAITAYLSISSDVAVGEGFTDSDAGWFGIALIVFGLIGAGIIGTVVDLTRKYREALIICFCCAVACIAWFVIGIMFSSSFVNVLIANAALGFFALALLPIAIEASVEVCYPATEGTVTGILMLVGNLWGVFLLVLMESLKQGDGSMSLSLWFMLFYTCCCCIGSFFFKGEYKRLQYEQSKKKYEPLAGPDM